MKKIFSLLIFFLFGNGFADLAWLKEAERLQDSGSEIGALAVYEKCASVSRDPEEIYLCRLKMARLQEKLKKAPEVIEQNYERAFAACPYRCEPLYYLGAYYRSIDQFEKSARALHASLAISKPEKAADLESWIYEWGALFEYSISTYWVGMYKETVRASELLLGMNNVPQYILDAAVRNRQFAINMLATYGL